MAILTRTGMAAWGVVLASAALFGFAHLYQGRGGLVGTLLVGIVFGATRIAYDSLVPVTLWHGTLDAVAGVVGSRYLIPANPSEALAEKESFRGRIGLLL